jgi:short-subunit dehydrogenase
VHEHYGRVDVLINNAGQGMHVPVAEADPDDYRAVLELNVVSVLVAMRAQGGVIVTISSGLSKRIAPGVGLMLPGLTATEFHRNAVGIGPERSERYRSMPADTPEHVAAKILEAVESEAAEAFADSIRPQG